MNCHCSLVLHHDTGEAGRRFLSLVALPRPGAAVVCAISTFEPAAGHTAGAGETAARSAVCEARNEMEETDSKNWDIQKGRRMVIKCVDGLIGRNAEGNCGIQN